MNYKTPKKLAVIQDMAGIGRCSLSVALPVISACHVQACPMPTALFSNHTGFPTYYKHDFTPYIPDYLDAWKKLDQHFDGIYCGYLGSSAQMELISSYIKGKISSAGHPYHDRSGIRRSRTSLSRSVRRLCFCHAQFHPFCGSHHPESDGSLLSDRHTVL